MKEKESMEMLPPTEYWQSLKIRKKQLQQLLTEIEKDTKKYTKQLEKSPNQELYTNCTVNISRSNGVPQFYLRKKRASGKKNYSPVTNKNIIQNLLQLNYYKKVTELAENELKALTKLLRFNSKIIEKFENQVPEKQKLIQPVTLPDKNYSEKWQQLEFSPKRFLPGESEYFTPKGLRVRSKSEIIIASVLDKYNVPYKYEFPLTINQKVFHPDFYCLNVRTRREYIWEHFGLMSNHEYSKNALEKLILYNQAGYFIGKNLLVSFEQSDMPVKTSQIEQIVKEFLI